jgi:hypothetical protein
MRCVVDVVGQTVTRNNLPASHEALIPLNTPHGTDGQAPGACDLVSPTSGPRAEKGARFLTSDLNSSESVRLGVAHSRTGFQIWSVQARQA